MKDKIGTLFGFVIGVVFVLFGIMWPDNLSNYHSYRHTQLQQKLEHLQSTNAPYEETTKAQEALDDFEKSWIAQLARFIDLKSFLIVFGGTYAAVLVAFPISRAISALRYISDAFSKDSMNQEFLGVYESALKFGKKRLNHEVILDEELNSVENQQFQKWLQEFILVDLVKEEMILEIINSEIQMYNRRSFEEIDILEFMGRAAPAFGMVGTITGLILMLGNVGDIIEMIGGMSISMITTFYGVAIANLVFIPVASKRYQFKETNIVLLEMIKEAVLYLKRRELPEVFAQDLIVYLPPKVRRKIESQQRAANKMELAL